jgi:hypothetical protein
MNNSIKLIGAALASGLVSVSVMAAKPGTTDDDGIDYNGNGSPSGSHYTLNILGMDNPKGKTEEETIKSNGRRIFVNISGNTKIMLSAGDFGVIDYDGTDGTAAFRLPNPDPDCDGTTEYSVYGRALGGGGSATMTTCADDGGETYCSTAGYVATFDRTSGGKSKFTNVSRELLYVTGDFTDDDTVNIKRYPLFGDTTALYYWDYDNDGLRLAQLRFYEIETDVTTYDTETVTCEKDFPEPEPEA